jgi:hypothetical protein
VVRGNASAIVALPTAAETVRFAVEDFPAIHMLGAWMQVGTSASTTRKSVDSMRVMIIPATPTGLTPNRHWILAQAID